MLSYQHGYHAGNYADVAKHIVLSRLINYLLRKDKSLFYLETHAGRGLYDLKNLQATKTKEAQHGIQLLWQKRDQLPSVFDEYMQILAQLNPDVSDSLQYYPGSPYFAIHQLRSQDRMICCELHPQEWNALQRMKKQGKRVRFLHEDGLLQLKALLPPLEKRGLIFVDPSYEIKTDYKTIPQVLGDAYQRFPTGVFVLWYPIVEQRLHEQLLRGLKQIKAHQVLRLEFWIRANSAEKKAEQAWQGGMRGCGLWIINPPYLIMDEAKTILHELTQYFNPGVSSFLVQ